MSRFALGLILGGYAGAVGTLILLLVVHSIPDGDSLHAAPDRWRDAASIVALTIASGVFLAALNLHQVAFATSIFLLLVFVAARRWGMLVSWVTLAIAALILCMLLPPVHTLRIANPQDQILLAFFMVCGAVGARLIAINQRARYTQSK